MKSLNQYSWNYYDKKYFENDRIHSKVKKFGFLFFGFWVSSHAFQRIFGIARIHSGIPRLFQTCAGLTSVTASCLIANEFSENPFSFKRFDMMKFDGSWKSLSNSIQNEFNSVILTIATYGLIERKLFISALPSSVNVLGVFAKTFASVSSSSFAATSSEKSKIQVLGRLYGCHHCGSRQIIKNRMKGFIADHMPPTKIVNELNSKFWRKLFGLKVTQRLFPQCQSCFLLQGPAVRLNKHVVVYHTSLRLYHFSPVIAALLLEIDEVQFMLKQLNRKIYNGQLMLKKYYTKYCKQFIE